MRSKRAVIIIGGLVLSSLLILLLAQSIQAQPLLPHIFNGEVRIGGQLKGGQEFRVKAFDEEQGQQVSVPLSAGSVNITSADGTFGLQAPFAVRGDDPDTAGREGAKQGERLFFFLVTAKGTGSAITKGLTILDDTKKVDVLLEAQSPFNLAPDDLFPVTIKVKPNGEVDRVRVFLEFSPATWSWLI